MIGSPGTIVTGVIHDPTSNGPQIKMYGSCNLDTNTVFIVIYTICNIITNSNIIGRRKMGYFTSVVAKSPPHHVFHRWVPGKEDNATLQLAGSDHILATRTAIKAQKLKN